MTRQTPDLASRRQIAIPMGTGIVLGIALGAAMGNIALGLAIGVILGGVGAVWRRKRG